MKIVDKRHDRQVITDSKKRFLDRHRRAIGDMLDEVIKNSSIKSLKNSKRVGVRVPSTKEYEPSYDQTPDRGLIYDNQRYPKGTKFRLPKKGRGKGKPQGSEKTDEIGEDDFTFVLTDKEFQQLLFDHLQLPNLKKLSHSIKKSILKRSGYTKYGCPSKLDLKKTFEKAIARKVATKNINAPFLDDIDLRYRNYKHKTIPWTKAVMFCIMDVSGSMDEGKKLLAKQFYYVLYLFLTSKYKDVDIVFIRYHTHAKEVDEQEFFYSRETGGTEMSSGFALADKIIKERYNPMEWNIYCANVGDGDNWGADVDRCIKILENDILPVSQYVTFLQVQEGSFSHEPYQFICKHLIEKHGNVNHAKADNSLEIIEAMNKFFGKS